MASLSGVSSSNTLSSLMNSANMISGLASGLDTESMIESLVQSYQTKINTLNQQVTKTEWKQDAYRSIISNLVGFNSKYTSYTSSTNLTSPSFFNSAVKVLTQGLFGDRVAASGKTDSAVSLDRVNQLAAAAQYRTASKLKAGDGRSIVADLGLDESGNPLGMDLNGTTRLTTLSGSLSLTYGSQTVSVSFDEVADVKALEEIKAKNEGISEDAALGKLIEQKLADQKITLTGGKSFSADERIKVDVRNGAISFSDKSTAGNSVYISGASGNVKEKLGLDLEDASTKKPASFTLSDEMKKDLTYEKPNGEYLSGKLMNLTLDGVTKQIKLPETVKKARLDSNGKPVTDYDGKQVYDYFIKDADGKKLLAYNAENYTKALGDAVNKAFKSNSKIEVSNADETGKSLRLQFKVQEGSELVINTSVGETLGIGRTATSYMNTSKTLGELLDDSAWEKLEPAMVKDKDGQLVQATDEKTGEPLYEFKINDVVVGRYGKDSKLSDVLNDINSNTEAGVKVSYSQTTKNFLFTAKETGEESEIKIDGGLAEAMFGTTKLDGSSASFAEAYGVSWLEEGQTEELSLHFPDFHTSFEISKGDSIEDVANKLNSGDALSSQGYTASYNKYTGQLEIKDKGGAKVDFSIKNSWGDESKFDTKYAPAISYTPGQDAKFTVTVNGEQKEMSRSTNSVNIDGLTITMKDTFDGYEDADGNAAVTSTGGPKNSVTFQSSTDSDKIVDAIKDMLSDYNSMMSEIKSAYSTMPYQKSNGTFANYEPLTEDDRSGMSESAIERYEEKAKQGILFGDRNLSNLYTKLSNVFNLSGADGATLREMGISVSYNVSDGSQAVTLDESKLRALLDSDPDRVADLFTKSNGVMQNMKTHLDTYARTTGEPKGILIQQSGSPLSSLSLMSNAWQKEIDNLNTQIETWQDKLASQVERYTSQFSRLEVLINQMNSQSSTLAGLMGG